MLKFAVISVCCLILYFLVDHTIEYRYWKKTKSKTNVFISKTVNDVRSLTAKELEDESNNLRLSMEKEMPFSSDSKKVENLARLYILNQVTSQAKEDYYDFGQRFLKDEGLAPFCHFEYLIREYQRQMEFQLLNQSNFCSGWNELDKDFKFWGGPHARGELRY